MSAVPRTRTRSKGQGRPPGQRDPRYFNTKVLTPRQTEVADLLVCGLDTHQIADRLQITERAVRLYIHQAADRVRVFAIDKAHRTDPEVEAREKHVVIVWRSKILGVLEFFAGIRDQEGIRFSEYDPPEQSPMHPHHETFFPEREPKCPPSLHHAEQTAHT